MPPLSAAILAEGRDDWVPLLSVHFTAEKLHSDLDEATLRKSIISAVRYLLDHGLAEVGTVSESDPGFVAWNVPTEAATQRLIDALATDDEALWAFSAWLNNTKTGNELAHAAETMPPDTPS